MNQSLSICPYVHISCNILDTTSPQVKRKSFGESEWASRLIFVPYGSCRDQTCGFSIHGWIKSFGGIGTHMFQQPLVQALPLIFHRKMWETLLSVFSWTMRKLIFKYLKHIQHILVICTNWIFFLKVSRLMQDNNGITSLSQAHWCCASAMWPCSLKCTVYVCNYANERTVT